MKRYKRLARFGDDVITMISNEPCKHNGDSESKSGGYVCLRCFHFLSYSQLKKDSQTEKVYSDIN